MWSVNLALKKLRQSAGAHKCLLMSLFTAQQHVVKACCASAFRLGVREGMPITLARAIAPDSLILSFDAARDFKVLHGLALKGLRYTPLSGLENEIWRAYEKNSLQQLSRLHWGLIMDITGTGKLYPCESQLAGHLLGRLREGGIDAKIGIAPTIGSAWAVSRYSEHNVIIIHRNALHDALAKLPVESLRIEQEPLRSLNTLGIYQICDLRKLPRNSLASRFGVNLITRLDQAYGHIEESFCPVHQKKPFHVNRRFEIHLADREQVERAAFLLLENLFVQLHEKGVCARLFRIILEIHQSGGNKLQEQRDMTLHSASENFSHVLSVIEPVIDSMHISGTVAAIDIFAMHTEHRRTVQSDFSGSEEADLCSRGASELIDGATSQIGSGNVCGVDFKSSYIPEKSALFVPSTQLKKRSMRPAEVPRFDRPPLLFRNPESINIISLLPDHPPSRIQWRGQSCRVTRSTGPERISAEWWEQYADNPIEERDYFKVQDETGRWLWIFRMKTTREWFVQGVWV